MIDEGLQTVGGSRALRRPRRGPVSLAARRLARASIVGAEVVHYLGSRPDELDVPTHERMRAQRWFVENLCASHGVHTTVRGDVPQGPCVIVANHLGYVEALAICSHVAATPIVKAQVRGWPLAGSILTRFAGLFVDRGDAHSGAVVLLRGLERLRRGVPIVGFPEGTTTTGTHLLPFRRGLFGLARIARVPVVPVGVRFDDPGLCWVGDAPFLTHYLRMISRPINHVHLTFGDPIDPYTAASAEQLASLAFARVAAMTFVTPS